MVGGARARPRGARTSTHNMYLVRSRLRLLTLESITVSTHAAALELLTRSRLPRRRYMDMDMAWLLRHTRLFPPPPWPPVKRCIRQFSKRKPNLKQKSSRQQQPRTEPIAIATIADSDMVITKGGS